MEKTRANSTQLDLFGQSIIGKTFPDYQVIAWSGSLKFTVERSGKSLIGSAASGEGLVNTYRGTGKVLLAPVR